MKDKIINVAIIGTGFGALVHLPAYMYNEHYNVIGIYGKSYDKTLQIANKHNIMAYKSIQEIIDDEAVDMVSIASIVSEHYDMAKSFIGNKKNILLEKPMAMDVNEALHLVQLASKYNTNVAIAYEHIYDPSWQQAYDLIRSKQYGEIRSIQIEYNFTYWNSENSERKYDWYSNKDLGGGMKGGHLSHVLRIVDYISNGQINNIYGKTFIEVPKHYDDKGILRTQTAEDTVVAIIELNNGTPVYVNLSAARSRNFKKVMIYTEKAQIEISDPRKIIVYDWNNTVCLNQIDPKYLITDYKKDFRINSFVKLLDDFYRKYYLDSKENYIVDFNKGCVLQKLLDQIE